MNNTNKRSTKFIAWSPEQRVQLQKRQEKNMKVLLVNNPKRQKKQKSQRNGGSSLGTLSSVPVAFSRRLNNGPVRFGTGRGGSRTIFYREYVQDILGSVAFSAATFPINPGIPTLFAWLANQAIFYQEYLLKKVKFLFETEKSTATSGKVMYAYQPDPTDALPASKQEMLENQYKAGGAPWEPFILDISSMQVEALGRKRFIRSGTLAANLDLKTYDIGQLIVAVQGMADTTAIGELYVEYEVELITPVLSLQALATSTSSQITGVAPAQGSIMGTTPTVTGGLDLTATVNTITFNRVGRYLVTASNVAGTGLFTAFNPVTSASTATVTLQNAISNAAANVGTTALFVHLVVVTTRGQTAVFDATTKSTTITASTILVSQFNVA